MAISESVYLYTYIHTVVPPYQPDTLKHTWLYYILFSLLDIEHLAIAKVPNNRCIHEFAGATTQSHIKCVFKIDYFVLHLTTPFYSVSLFLPYIAVNIYRYVAHCILFRWAAYSSIPPNLPLYTFIPK